MGNARNLIVFDWNGTILADTSACLNATNTVLGKLGLPAVTRGDYQKHYTMPIANLYHALGVTHEMLDKHVDVINPLWHATYSAAPIRLRRGAKTMLQHLQMMKCSRIILSNYTVHHIEAQAQRLGVREYFEQIIAFHSGDAAFRKVGKGARLREHINDNPFDNGVIIGDSEEEVQIGRETGMTTVAIADGMCSTARLRAMKPDYLIRSLTEIPAIAKHCFSKTRLTA